MLELTSTPTRQNDRMAEEKEFNNDSAIVLGDSVGSIIDTSCDTTEEPDQNTCQKERISKKKISGPCPFCQNSKLHSALTRQWAGNDANRTTGNACQNR